MLIQIHNLTEFKSKCFHGHCMTQTYYLFQFIWHQFNERIDCFKFSVFDLLNVRHKFTTLCTNFFGAEKRNGFQFYTHIYANEFITSSPVDITAMYGFWNTKTLFIPQIDIIPISAAVIFFPACIKISPLVTSLPTALKIFHFDSENNKTIKPNTKKN